MSNENPDLDRLTQVRHELLKLHKILLDSERTEYEAKYGRVPSAGAMLELVINNPWFAWLRPVSALIVEIDEAMDGEEPMTPELVAGFFGSARRLLKPAENETGLGEPYHAALQREIDVVLQHAAVMKLLS